MKIAYLINQYPKISHSFIRREILAFLLCARSYPGWPAAEHAQSPINFKRIFIDGQMNAKFVAQDD